MQILGSLFHYSIIFSFHHQTNSELEDSIPWLSNLTIKGENVEREIKDPDLRRYIEAVRDTFIVEPMPESYFMRPKRYNSEDEIVQSGLGKRNFKLFKKVGTHSTQFLSFPYELY